MALPSSFHPAGAVRIALATAVVLAGCDGTSPNPTLTGVWASRHAHVTDSDSLTLALNQEGSQVRGFGIMRRSDDPNRYYDRYVIHGFASGRSVELSLSR